MPLLTTLRKKHKMSERDLSAAAGMARATLRACEQNTDAAKIQTIKHLAQTLGYQATMVITPAEAPQSQYSALATSFAVERDGFASWKIHYMNFVDHFRKSLDVRLIMLPPIGSFNRRLTALLGAIVASLCTESDLDAPDWARQEIFLDEPWFVSGSESLKASALVESPLAFRRNNIFVHGNFLQRA